MFSQWILCAFLFYYLSNSNAAGSVKDVETNRKERGTSFFAPIQNLIVKFSRLFSKPTEQVIQEKKEDVTSAYAPFFDQILREKKVSDEMENELHMGPYNLPFKHPARTSFDDRPEMSADQLIAAHGYLSESHTALTEDGYMITMQRVIRDFERVRKKVVILHHGLFGSSEDWLLQGPHGALPYLLTENGFDVWLLNARGNRYSRMHKSKNIDNSDFWNFSWHEMGVYDLPASIEYISKIAKSSELNFICYSMGCTALLVLLSTMPQYNTILRSGTLIAPLAYMYHARGPIKLLANFYRENGQHSLDFLGHQEFMQKEVFPEQIIERYCKGAIKSCHNPLLLFGNGGKGAWEPKLTADVFAHVPAGGSVKTLIHYVQLVKSGYFQMFDYGADINLRKYGTNTPELYNLKGITLPIALFSSPSDWLATTSDIQTLLPLLQDVNIHHVVKSENFGHFDFLWSPDAPELIYNFILPLLNKQLPKRNQPCEEDEY